MKTSTRKRLEEIFSILLGVVCGLIFILFWSCEQKPTEYNYPSAKISAQEERWTIQWDCKSDSVWTVFHGDHRFVHRDTSSCVITSDDITDSSYVRIYQGLIKEDQYNRYYLVQDEELFLITRRYVTSSGDPSPEYGIIWHRDFADFWNEDLPRPDGLTKIIETGYRRYFHLYYLPFNFSRSALDTLTKIPRDDREYLDGHMVSVLVDVEEEMVDVEEEIVVVEEEPNTEPRYISVPSADSQRKKENEEEKEGVKVPVFPNQKVHCGHDFHDDGTWNNNENYMHTGTIGDCVVTMKVSDWKKICLNCFKLDDKSKCSDPPLPIEHPKPKPPCQ